MYGMWTSRDHFCTRIIVCPLPPTTQNQLVLVQKADRTTLALLSLGSGSLITRIATRSIFRSLVASCLDCDANIWPYVTLEYISMIHELKHLPICWTPQCIVCGVNMTTLNIHDSSPLLCWPFIMSRLRFKHSLYNNINRSIAMLILFHKRGQIGNLVIQLILYHGVYIGPTTHSPTNEMDIFGGGGAKMCSWLL